MAASGGDGIPKGSPRWSAAVRKTDGRATSKTTGSTSAIVAELNALPRSGNGQHIADRLSPDQKAAVNDSLEAWTNMPAWDRPTKTDVVKLWEKHGIKVTMTTAARWFNRGRID